MHYSPVRHSPAGASSPAAVRLACVKHAASVQSEPGSNSSVQFLFLRLSAISNTKTSLALKWNRKFPSLLPSSSVRDALFRA